MTLGKAEARAARNFQETMNTKTAQQFEADLIDELFANLTQPIAPEFPRQIEAPQPEPPRPYFAGHQKLVERQQIEAQISALIQASTTRVYEMLARRFDELKAQQSAEDERERAIAKRHAELLEIEQAARAASASPCTPSRQDWYS